MDNRNDKREYEDISFNLDDIGNNGKEVKKKKREKKEKKPSKLREKWSSLKKWKKAVIIIIAVLLLLAVIAFAVIWGIYDGFRTDIDEENLGISSDIEEKYGDTGIFNIAIFGVDTRDEDAFTGRSDSIIIVSVDKANNTVKLTSILRDSYVAIEGYSNQKITHAYSFGGAELAIKTINQNFNMNITDYATINFYKLADAIDVLGGIDIEITESEMEQINSEATGGSQSAELLTDYGYVHLNGDQASIYTRLRHYDSDEVRSQRQKNVIYALINQAKQVSPSKYAEVVKTIMSLCETSLSFGEVMSYAPMITEDIDVSAITIPGEPENAEGGIYEGAWVWRYDLSAAADRIHLFIYGEVAETTTSSSASVTKAASTTKASTKSTTAAKSQSTTSASSDTGDESPAETTTLEDVTQAETTTAEQTTAATTEAQTTSSNQSGETTASDAA